MSEVMKAYDAFSEAARRPACCLGGEGLEPSATATTVRVRDGERVLSDGPFAETKEQLGGFYLLDCDDLDEAIDWAAKIPGAATGSVEVRPVMDYEGAGSEDARQSAAAHELAAPGAVVDRLFRRESGRAVAALIRVLGDFDLAEDAVQDAFARARGALAARRACPRTRAPGSRSPRATARSTGSGATGATREKLGSWSGSAAASRTARRTTMSAIPDDRLRLFFTCCHPALAHRGARGAHAAHPRRALDARDRARVPDGRDGHGSSGSSAPSARSATAGIPYEVPADDAAARAARAGAGRRST